MQAIDLIDTMFVLLHLLWGFLNNYIRREEVPCTLPNFCGVSY